MNDETSTLNSKLEETLGCPLISVIIPTLNEESHIGSLLESLRGVQQSDGYQHEIIIVDGGSSDKTTKLCEKADLLIHSKPGRAIQQNVGAQKAKGDILLFLHADCKLEPGSFAAIRKLLANSENVAGCFRQHIDHPAWKYRVLEQGNAWRVRWFQSAYGDQGIFMTRTIFERIGGFPDYPFLEDLFIMKKIRKLGKVKLLQEKIVISPRRWQKTGVLKQTLINRLVVLAAHLGVSPHVLARYYPQVR